MFTLPLRPPKDYELKETKYIRRSGEEFYPECLPKVTNRNFGIYCNPIEYKDNEIPDIPFQPTNPRLLERQALKEKAWWVTKPGVDDKFLHELYNKYNVVHESYNTTFKKNHHVFYRPFYFEFECQDNRRLQKLKKKMEREEYEFETPYNIRVEKKIAREKPKLEVQKCILGPPMWWKGEENEEKNSKVLKESDDDSAEAVVEPAVVRTNWQEAPRYDISNSDVDPCERMLDMQLFNQPFRSEACNFYYTNYPPPRIKFRPEKFGEFGS